MVTMINTGENERLFEPEGSGKIYLRRRDPYGFWYITFEKGPIPETLSSAFTSPLTGKAAVENYLATNAARKRAVNKSE